MFEHLFTFDRTYLQQADLKSYALTTVVADDEPTVGHYGNA
jgi:hypothetical protein